MIDDWGCTSLKHQLSILFKLLAQLNYLLLSFHNNFESRYLFHRVKSIASSRLNSFRIKVKKYKVQGITKHLLANNLFANYFEQKKFLFLKMELIGSFLASNYSNWDKNSCVAWTLTFYFQIHFSLFISCLRIAVLITKHENSPTVD